MHNKDSTLHITKYLPIQVHTYQQIVIVIMAWAPLSLNNLTDALHEVDDWQGLGIKLDIGYHELQKFASENRKIEEQKRAMLQFWLDKEPKASWKILLSALDKLNLRRAAEEIEKGCFHR